VTAGPRGYRGARVDVCFVPPRADHPLRLCVCVAARAGLGRGELCARRACGSSGPSRLL